MVTDFLLYTAEVQSLRDCNKFVQVERPFTKRLILESLESTRVNADLVFLFKVIH